MKNALSAFKSIKQLFFIVLSIYFIHNLNAQTGPGGVGNATGILGQPENTLWLETGSLPLTNNQPVTLWPDRSGNEYHASQAQTARQPEFLSEGSYNLSLPVVRFYRTNDSFLNFSGNTVEGSDYTIFVVAANRTGGNQWVMGGTGSGANQNLHFGWQSNTTYRFHHWGNDYLNIPLETNEPGTGTGSFGIMTLLNDNSRTNRFVFQNNAFIGSGASSAHVQWQGAGLGGYPTTGHHRSFSNIDVAEVILYRHALNDAQIQIVSQYLNVKYGIAINNDLFSPDASYVFDLAGIGEASNGQHSQASSAGFYLTALAGLTTGDYVFASHNNAANAVTDFTSGDLPAGVEKRYNRVWELKTTNTPQAQIAFAFGEAVENGQFPANPGNYVLLRRNGTSGTFEVVKNGDGIVDGDKVYFNLSTAELQDGYYTLGTTDEIQSPLQGRPGRTWYTLVSGNWDNWEIWTLDPAGALPDNPGQYTPSTSPTSEADNVVILTGRTVEVDQNNLNHNILRVEGRLDLKQTTGHQFAEIRGTGRMLLASDNFPQGDATHFITKGQGEGTVVYYGNNLTLSTPREFFEVRIELNNPSNILTLLADYTINGNLRISRGNFRINNDTSSDIRTIVVKGDVDVLAEGSITTGQGDTRNGFQIGSTLPNPYHSPFHQVEIYGNFTNRGTVRFTNQNAPVYNAFTTTGAATVTFSGPTNNEVKLYGQTDFYNLIIDKGEDKTYELSVFASSEENFTLFGPNNVGRNQNAPYSASNPEVRKALWIKNGTLKLTGHILIPTLTEGATGGGNGDYPIGENARLWIAGSNVRVYSTASSTNEIDSHSVSWVQTNGSNQALSIYGEFRITNGFFGTRNSAGFIFWSQSNAQVKIDGGEVNISQLRSAASGGGVASYIQTGGTLIVRGSETEPAEISNSHALFSIDDETGVFSMSGGEIILNSTAGSSTNGLFIPSAAGNYNVTGGKVTVQIRGNRTFEIGSNAPLYNLDIKRLNDSHTATVRLTQDLRVLNDLLIDRNTLLDVRKDGVDYDVYIGRIFDLAIGGQYNARNNTTHFTGNQPGRIYARDISQPAPLVFNHVNIHKDQAWNPSTFRSVSLGNTGRIVNPDDNNNTAIEIRGNLTITRGELNTFRYRMLHLGNAEIINGRILSNNTNPGRIELRGNSRQTLKGPVAGQASFGNIVLNNGNGAELLTNAAVDNIILQQGTMFLHTHNLRVSGSVSPGAGEFSENRMFCTAGNGGDGGLTLQVSQDGSYLFPLGTNANGNTRYTPLTANYTDVVDSGWVTLSVDDRELPTLNQGNNIDALSYSWRIRHSDFEELPWVNSYVFTCSHDDYPGNNPWGGNWRPGKVVGTERSNENGSNLSGTSITFNAGFDLEEGFYTAAQQNAFSGQLRVFYSRGGQGMKNWNSNQTWSYNGHTGGPVPNGNPHRPGSGDIVIIGYNPDIDNGYHWINMNQNNIEVAEIRFAGDGSTWNPRLYIQNGHTQNLGSVSGRGDIRLYVRNGSIPTVHGDLGDFLNGEHNVFAYHINNNSHVNIPANIQVFPNLRIEAEGANIGNRSISFEEDIHVKRNLVVDGNSTLILHSGDHGNITVEGNTNIGGYLGGRIYFPTSGPAKTLAIHGNLRLRQDTGQNTLEVLNNNPNSLEHRLLLGGDLIHEAGSINLANDNTNGNNVTLELIGNSNGEYTRTGGSEANFYRIVMNKNAAGLVTFSFNSSFQIHGPTDGDHKAIELISGRLGLRHSGIDVTLTSGGADFKIPQGSELWMGSSATARISGNNTGIWLDGKLTMGYGTKGYFNEGTNNYIEYTASGQSEIDINSGDSKLLVGSQIRRSTLTEEGILRFRVTHSSSEVVIGTQAGHIPENNRGVFELLNAGSRLVMGENTTITIANAQNNASFPSVYLQPASHELGQGSVIQAGGIPTASDQTIGIYSSIPLENLSVSNTSENDPTLRLWRRNITINQDISIDNNSTLDANAWDITIKGNFHNYGNYKPAGNTTIFSGSATQHIHGKTPFHNLVKNQSNGLHILDSVMVSNELNLLSGSFHDNGNTISVQGHVVMNVEHFHEGSGNGIVFNGSSQQTLTGNGSFGKLTIHNPAGVAMPIGSTFRIKNELQLISGVLNIDRNLLVIEEQASITEANPFSENNMIQTNISFTDAGIMKYFPQVSASDNYVFTFPIGSEGKYTPIRLNIENLDAGGTIRVKAANELHPTINNDDSSCPEILNTENVLHYHWLMEGNNINGFTGNVTMRFYPEDYRIDTEHYTANDYITARLLWGTTEWNKFGPESFDLANRRLSFSFSNTDDSGISGDYTAGVEDPWCEGAIPNDVPAYISISNGNWTDASIWDTYPESGGTVPSGGPRGSVTYVEHVVTIPENYTINYKTVVRNNGMLRLGSTFANRLGFVNGNGVIQLERGNLPAGIYEEFFGPNGGTLEFTGHGDYDVLSEITTVRNLIFSGTGERRLPNLDFLIYDDLTINGDDNTLHIINEHDRRITINRDIIFNNGTFYAGIGTSAIIMGGTLPQFISGSNSFTGNNALWNLEVNNERLTLQSPVDVDRNLLFSSGIIRTTEENILTIVNPSPHAAIGYNQTRYVHGPMRKYINSDSYFTFPVGKNNHFGPIGVTSPTRNAIWKAEYFTANPHTDMGNGVEQVSLVDYWSLEDIDDVHPEAIVTLSWGANTGVMDERFLVVAELDETGTWQSRGGASITGDPSFGYVSTDRFISFSEKFFTVGSTSNINPLPIELLSFEVYMDGDHAMMEWVTASERNNNFFTVERSRNGKDFEIVGVYASQAVYGNSNQNLYYDAIDTQPLKGISYYRLKQTDFDGTYEYSDLVVLDNRKTNLVQFNLMPNPNRGTSFRIALNGLSPHENLNVSVVDLYGRSVYNNRMQANDSGGLHSFIIPPGRLSDGVYMVNISGVSGNHTMRMIVK